MKKKIVKIVFAVFIILFLIIQIYPVIWLFIASVKPSVELASAPFALPKSVTFENFCQGALRREDWNLYVEQLEGDGHLPSSDRGTERYGWICLI